MTEDYRLLTPENVELRYDVAGLGSRLMAAFIDYTILSFGYLTLFFAAAFVTAALGPLIKPLPDARLIEEYLTWGAIAIAVLLVFFGWWGYFLLFELLWNGQTPGKRMFHLRVVGQGGQPVTGTASLVRNLIRVVDLTLTLGVVVMAIDRRSRRLGDFAAGTLVVREPGALRRGSFAPVPIPPGVGGTTNLLPNADRLTMADYTLVRDFFSRRQRLSEAQANSLAATLATELARKIEVPAHQLGDPSTFLANVLFSFEHAHAYYDAST